MATYNIKARREQLGLRLSDVAAAVGVTGATVSRWESGEIDNMKRSYIAALAEVLRIDPLLLIGCTEEELPLNSDEMELITLYRASNEQGRIAAKAVLSAALKQDVSSSRSAV